VETTLLLTDNDLNIKQEVPFSVPDADYIGINSLQRMGDKTYFFYAKRMKRSDEVSFCAMVINEADIKKSSELVLGTFQADGDQTSFNLKPSMDSTSYLLFVETAQKKHDNKNFYFAVFDKNLNKIWDKNATLSAEARFIDIYSWTHKDINKVYVSYKHYDNEVSRESIKDDDGSRIPSYSTRILIFKKDEDKPVQVPMNLGDKFVHSSEIIFNNKTNKIVVLGTYKNRHNGNVNGVYYGALDPAKDELSSLKKTPFPAAMVELLKKDGFASKKESDPGLLVSYLGVDTRIRDNGGIDYLLEYRRATLVTYYNGKTTYTILRHRYGSIVDAHFKDETASFTRIPKIQTQDNASNLLSFYPIVSGNKLILLYNDDDDNATRDLDRSPDDITNFRKAVLMAATIDENGKLQRDIVMDTKKSDNYITNINLVQHIDPQTLIFTQTKAKSLSSKTRYGTMTIK